MAESSRFEAGVGLQNQRAADDRTKCGVLQCRELREFRSTEQPAVANIKRPGRSDPWLHQQHDSQPANIRSNWRWHRRLQPGLATGSGIRTEICVLAI